MVLSLFIPLCISTGGNSGSQAATLITRAGPGHSRLRDWCRVLRHELLMGLVLGVTLGVIGFFRGAATSEDLRSRKKELEEPMQVAVPAGDELHTDGDGRYVIPVGAADGRPRAGQAAHPGKLPTGASPEATVLGTERVYSFPRATVTRTETVGRWQFALVIALSVAFICLWGTIIGAMLPLGFHEMGWTRPWRLAHSWPRSWTSPGSWLTSRSPRCCCSDRGKRYACPTSRTRSGSFCSPQDQLVKREGSLADARNEECTCPSDHYAGPPVP